MFTMKPIWPLFNQVIGIYGELALGCFVSIINVHSMNTKDPKLTALQFNEYINRQDIKGLNNLMTEDHTFIDRADAVTKGKDVMIKEWLEFFKAHPEYRNVFVRVDSKDDLVILFGYAFWSREKPNDPAIWTARIKNDRVSEWRIYEDTAKNRKKFRIR